jgi:ribose transport system permease protein
MTPSTSSAIPFLEPLPWRARLGPFKKELTMLGVTLTLALVTALLNPSFLSADNLRNNVRHVSLIALFALGEAIVIIAGGIDLSIGSLICLSAVATSYLAMVQGLSIAAAVALALLLAVAVGAAQGAVRAWLGLQPFIVTLGTMLLLRGLAEILTGGADIGFQGRFPGFRWLGDGLWLGLPVPFWFALAAMAAAAFVMHRTLLGRYCYAIGSNETAARLSGVPVELVQLSTFVAAGLLAGVSGILYVAYLPTATPALGTAYELHAVAAAVLGGCSLKGGRGTVAGVIVGAALLQITFNAVNLVGNSLWQNAVAGTVILCAVIVDRIFERRT